VLGLKKGFGADGDHLKKPEEIEYALSLGFTMITLDCSDYIRNDVNAMTAHDVKEAIILSDEIKNRYLDQTFEVEGYPILFDEISLKRTLLIYGKAIDYAVKIYETYLKDGKFQANFEVSIDETETPTEPLQHFFVANELSLRGVKLDTMAPRFIGEFQKGVDYIGDIDLFEEELKIHAAIARYFGYKLSIHSGSDKFSIFELIGKHTKGLFHVKTAGTNWLEAMKLVAMRNPKLYREIHAYALSMFLEAKNSIMYQP
jgi:tagaturonate epimerase